MTAVTAGGTNSGGTQSKKTEPILDVRGLKTYFFTRAGEVRAVDGVDISLMPGEIVGLVGESGSGKSVTSMSILQLVGDPGKIVAGEVIFDGQRLDQMGKRQMRAIRGDRISMVFQQPNASLNPVFRAGEQIAEVYAAHTALKKAKRNEKAIEMLEKVGIPDPTSRAKAYPHELSGGMAQRVMIAMALAGNPEVLIADEPTTALDVTIQAQILDLMVTMRDELGTAILLITHDLGVVAETADRVAVMYAGQIVEESPTDQLFSDPQHPYTQGLIGSIPMPGERRDRLTVIPGRVPNLVDLPTGCRFAPRCEARIANNLTRCTEEEPVLLEVSAGRKVRCWLFDEETMGSGTFRARGAADE